MTMKKILMGVLLSAALPALGVSYETKSATGTTAATVFFPGGLGPLRITSVDVAPGTIQLLVGAPIETLRENLVGRAIESLGRRGKYLMFGLDDGRVFVVHLRMTGRLVWRPRTAPPTRSK